jgi:hypothetical protein
MARSGKRRDPDDALAAIESAIETVERQLRSAGDRLLSATKRRDTIVLWARHARRPLDGEELLAWTVRRNEALDECARISDEMTAIANHLTALEGQRNRLIGQAPGQTDLFEERGA